MKKHYNICVKGRVQGVGYRYFILHAANKNSIKGFVRNKTDASVYIEAEAKEAILDIFLMECKQGPPLADVYTINKSESELINFDDFRIR